MLNKMDILQKKLKNENIFLELYVVGGFALELYGIRKSNGDIDAYWESTPEKDEVIKQFNLETGCDINDEVRTIRDLVYRFNPNKYVLYKDFGNLKLYVPEKEFLVVQKVVAAAIDKDCNRHISDIVLLAKDMGFSEDFYKIYDFFEKYKEDDYGIELIIKYLQDRV